MKRPFLLGHHIYKTTIAPNAGLRRPKWPRPWLVIAAALALYASYLIWE